MYSRSPALLLMMIVARAVFSQPTVDTCDDDRCQQMNRDKLQDDRVSKLMDLIDDLRVENRRLYQELAAKVDNLTELGLGKVGPPGPPGATGATGPQGDFGNCPTNPCVNGNCTYFVIDYRCDCIGGWTGKNCSTSLSGHDLMPYIVVGARVVRNPAEWDLGDEDCGGPGTVTEPIDSLWTCGVQWDCEPGISRLYRMGYQGQYVLLLTNL